MIINHSKLNIQISDFLISRENANNIKHIGKTVDSHVFRFNNNFICKCVVKEYGISVWKETEVLDFLLKDNKEYLSCPIKKFEIDEPHLLHTLVMYIFPLYDYNIDNTLQLNEIKDTIWYQSLGQQLYKALDNLHNMGYYHGDLKPLNICIHNEKICLIDFGTTYNLENGCIFRKNTLGWCTPIQFIKIVKKCIIYEENPLTRVIKFIKEILINKYKFDEELKEDPIKNDYFVASMINIYLYSENFTNFWEYDNNEELKNNIIKMAYNIILFLNDPNKYIDSFHIQNDIRQKLLDILVP